jgi:transposase
MHIRSRLKRCKLQEMLRYFVAGATARVTAGLCGVHRHSAELLFHKVREEILRHAEAVPAQQKGVFELDESYWGGRKKDERGRCTASKIPVFGILERNKKVTTFMVDDVSIPSLEPLIKLKIKPDSMVYTDSFSSYNRLNAWHFRHERINHQEKFAEGPFKHINGIENFWRQARRSLCRYNHIPRSRFVLFLKEAEFRFNCRTPSLQLKTLKQWLYL